jgi:hypothetical protein
VKWKDKTLNTLGEVAGAVIACTTKEEAEEFIKAWVASGTSEDVARKNVGYLSGYYDRATQERIFELFSTEHPIFGTKQPTPEEAFAAGMTIGKAMKKV